MKGIEASEHQARRTRLREALLVRQLNACVVSSPADLLYLTGYDGISPLGPNPFIGGPSASLLLTATASVLCLPQQDEGLLAEDPSLDHVVYPTFLQLEPIFPRNLFRHSLTGLIQSEAARGRLAFQPESMPSGVLHDLNTRLPTLELSELGDLLATLRMRKSPAEVAAIRQSVAVCDAAQATVRRVAHAGVSEMAILDAILSTVRGLAEGDVPLLQEVTSGPRSGRIGFSASERVLQNGDLLLTDIAPRVDGYWSDSSGTMPIGEVSPEQTAMLRVVGEALELGTGAVRPGVRASEVDHLMREHVGNSFPAYHNCGGHGIGLDYHELPRLVPAEVLPLEEDMVLAMEPGIYIPDVAGVRIEHIVLVTADGCEVLSQHLTESLN